MIGGNIKTFQLTESELQTVVSGMRDAVNNKEAKVKVEEYGPKVQALAQSRAKKVAESEGKKGKLFAEKAAKESGAKKLPSGLVYKETKAGSGSSPKSTDVVKVHYTGKLVDGEVFDSSIERKEPTEFPLGRVMPCWTEALQLMKVGGKATIVCPPELAYGEQGRPPKIPGKATLVFDVELLNVSDGKEDPAQGMMSLKPPSLNLKKPSLQPSRGQK
ncbi:MAG: FKBP-type peptidyl-prolyl cis-trans isomerase [Myxococcales bacterium]|nr:FKBP-type peptidyl-prolyl cis-trans isomerase [Myxococcales bacterium]